MTEDTRAPAGSIPEWAASRISELDAKMGLELTELTGERCQGRVPVQGNTQPFGLWHGGASCVVAESLASMAANALVQPNGIAVGLDINATHHASARSGWIEGVATALHVTGRTASYEVVLTNDGRRICTSRVTMFLKRG